MYPVSYTITIKLSTALTAVYLLTLFFYLLKKSADFFNFEKYYFYDIEVIETWNL